jgi:hypothetical protein
METHSNVFYNILNKKGLILSYSSGTQLGPQSSINHKVLCMLHYAQEQSTLHRKEYL